MSVLLALIAWFWLAVMFVCATAIPILMLVGLVKYLLA